MTLIEVMVTAAILAILVIPITRFTTSMLRWFVSLEAKHKGEEKTRIAMVDMERDFKDMNEIVFASSHSVVFYMDSHRMPTYNPNGSNDTDGVPNRTDVDDDGDGFDALMSASVFGLTVSISTQGWRNGLDLQDDDDDNDGQRDVVCDYTYFPGDRALRRRFNYNNSGWTPYQLVADRVIDFKLDYFGSPTIPDPNTGRGFLLADSNSDGIFSLDEIEQAPQDGVLDRFEETRCILRVEYFMEIQPNPNLPLQTQKSNSSIMPPLMCVKEKFR